MKEPRPERNIRTVEPDCEKPDANRRLGLEMAGMLFNRAGPEILDMGPSRLYRNPSKHNDFQCFFGTRKNGLVIESLDFLAEIPWGTERRPRPIIWYHFQP